MAAYALRAMGGEFRGADASGAHAGVIRALDFPALLRTLQGWLGCDLCVVVHRPDSQFNIGFCSRLERIRSPSGDGGPAILDFDGARELTLAPVEGAAYLHAAGGPGGTAEWIEISLAFGMVTTIERLSR